MGKVNLISACLLGLVPTCLGTRAILFATSEERDGEVGGTSSFEKTAACPNPVKVEAGYVCKCDAAQCGSLVLPTPAVGQALIVQSAYNAGFFMPEVVQTTKRAAGKKRSRGQAVLKATDRTPSWARVPILGFGAAFTDAMAYNYAKLTPEVQDVLIESLFGASGSGYSTGRVHAGSCDFSRMDYHLVNSSADYQKGEFCLRDDREANAPCGVDYKTRPILAAQATLQAAERPELKLFVSAWSPPTWLKDYNFSCEVEKGNNRCDLGAAAPAIACDATVAIPCSDNPMGTRCPQQPVDPTTDCPETSCGTFSDFMYPGMKNDLVGTEMIAHNAHGNCYFAGMLSDDLAKQQAWADILVSFVEAYQELGIPVWGMTVQNEPLTQTGLWNANFGTPELQASFVKAALGPALRKRTPSVKLMIHDDATTDLLSFAGKVLDDKEAAAYVDGVGYHWYNTLEGLYENSSSLNPVAPLTIDYIPWVGGAAYVRTISERLAPDGKFTMMTEACNGFMLGNDGYVGSKPGEWGYGFSYSHDIMWQLKNGAVGWTDWNMILDANGGPNHAGNQVDAPILVQDADNFHQNPSYFHFAHFSRFVPRGSRLVELTLESCTLRNEAYCHNTVAFVTPVDATPSNSLVFIITNDEVTAVPNYAGGAGTIVYADIAKGQGTLNPGLFTSKEVDYSVGCGDVYASGSLKWKAIATVVIPCGDQPCAC